MRVLPAVAAVLAMLTVACGGGTTPTGGSGGSAGTGEGGSGGTGGSGTACRLDKDCADLDASKPFCQASACVACRGTGPTDCKATPQTPACVSGVCSACTENTQCGLQVCNTTKGTCQDCNESSNCHDGSKPNCDDQGLCVACTTDAQCITGGDCENEKCVRACATQAQCQNLPGYVCVANDRGGTCEKSCNPENPGTTCTAGLICNFLGTYDKAHHPQGACVKPADGADVGQPCRDVVPCKTGLVCAAPPGGSGFCVAGCTTGSDTCGQGLTCGVALGPNEGDQIHVCVGAACQRDGDCRADQTCSDMQGHPDNKKWDLACQFTTQASGKTGGDTCTANADCKSGTCLTSIGACLDACLGNSDCAAGAACVDVGFADGTPPVAGRIDPSKMVYAATICDPTCGNASDCGSKRACAVVDTKEFGKAAVCSATVDGKLPPGADCTKDDSCAALVKNTCTAQGLFGPPLNYCHGACKTNDDCKGNTVCQDDVYWLPGPDNLLNTSDDGFATLKECSGNDCTTDNDCASGWVCKPTLDPRDATHKSLVLRCDEQYGNSVGGQKCMGAATYCESDICYDPQARLEDCHNGIDDDGNGKIDCADPACASVCNVERDCTDGKDNDGDGAIDCGDGDCYVVCHIETNCKDGIDNDHDGKTDCDDPDCAFFCGKDERSQCADGLDNDGDGLVDCADPDCYADTYCTEFNCTDGADNDGDGLADCNDPDCVNKPVCKNSGQEMSDAECSDGKDNDNDGKIDCADPTCRYATPCLETSCTTGNCCGDGKDNDGDGHVDCADPDCFADAACTEVGRCADGIDNDKDGEQDCYDSDCSTDAACNEAVCTGGNCCGDGIDNDGDGGIDCADYDCFTDSHCTETACAGGNCCANGMDDDGNGLTDCADPKCANDFHCRENICNDGKDNDGDGLIDCADPDCAGPGHLFECGQCFQSCTMDQDCTPPPDPTKQKVVCQTNALSTTVPGGDYAYSTSCVYVDLPMGGG